MSSRPGWPDGHFYSPVPSPDDVERALAWHERADPARIPGIDLDLDAMWALAAELAEAVGPFRLHRTAGQGRLYGWENGQFNACDAGVLTAVLARARPRRVVEVGSGFSTACMIDACRAFDLPTRIVTIDPFPERFLQHCGPAAGAGVELLAVPVQEVGLEPFLQLGHGDVLFIDSSHVAKAGSDVLYELFEVLPRLAPGVLVHVHDVFPGFEYPRDWLAEGRYWTEAYLLRAFLIGNRDCRVELWATLLAGADPERFAGLLPICNGAAGGSLWLATVASWRVEPRDDGLAAGHGLGR